MGWGTWGGDAEQLNWRGGEGVEWGMGGHLVRNTHLSRQQRECKRFCQHQERVVQFKPFAKKRSLCPRSPRILFTLHCLSVWIATQSNTLQMFSVSLTRLSQPMPHHMCRLIKQAIFLGADSRPMTINISASSFRISSGFIKYLNPSVLWAQSKQRANQRTTTDID